MVLLARQRRAILLDRQRRAILQIVRFEVGRKTMEELLRKGRGRGDVIWDSFTLTLILLVIQGYGGEENGVISEGVGYNLQIGFVINSERRGEADEVKGTAIDVCGKVVGDNLNVEV